jgi:DNA-directed RNA polymerase subunit omega
MIYPSIDKLLNKVGSKYLLINLISKRVEQIKETGHYQLKESEYVSVKPIGRALEEVARDMIKIES